MNENKSIRKLIKEFSIERNFYLNDNESERVIRKMERALRNGEAADSGMMAGEDAEDYAVFLQYTGNMSPDEVKSKILSRIPEENKYRLYFIVILTDTFERKAELSAWAREIRGAVKKKIRCGLSVIHYQILSYYNERHERFVIDIGDRLNAITMSDDVADEETAGPQSIAKKVKAYTYTASLYDIVQMYNRIGDELFRGNVRYSIRDQLDVEENIKKTLRESPEDFWFLNNGITIIVQDENAFDNSRKRSVSLDYKKSEIISVINGAQTISTAAEFWYQDTGAADSTQDEATRRNAEEKARVLLRIMCVSHGGENCQEELDRISISLNRQKPIKSEDIAYTSPVILEINQLFRPDKMDDIHFRITKRGEKILGKYQYNLTEFARVVKAYRAQKPGEARSQTTNKILQHTQGDEDSVYVDRILEQDAESVFNECYRPTNFAMRALAYYKEAGKRLLGEVGRTEEVILGNGRYYFTAYLVHVLHEENTDFTDFAGKAEKLDENFDDTLKEYLRILGKIAQEYLKEAGEENVDSNTFKTDKLYQKLCCYGQAGEMPEIREEVQELEEKIRRVLLEAAEDGGSEKADR